MRLVELAFCWSPFCAFEGIGVLLDVVLCVWLNCHSVCRGLMGLIELAFC